MFGAADFPRPGCDLAGASAASSRSSRWRRASLALLLAAAWAAGAVLLAIAALIRHFWPDPRRGLGPANRVTLVRALLVALLAGMFAAPAWVDAHPCRWLRSPRSRCCSMAWTAGGGAALALRATSARASTWSSTPS